MPSNRGIMAQIPQFSAVRRVSPVEKIRREASIFAIDCYSQINLIFYSATGEAESMVLSAGAWNCHMGLLHKWRHDLSGRPAQQEDGPVLEANRRIDE
jgi:hypothetical protein